MRHGDDWDSDDFDDDESNEDNSDDAKNSENDEDMEEDVYDANLEWEDDEDVISDGPAENNNDLDKEVTPNGNDGEVNHTPSIDDVVT